MMKRQAQKEDIMEKKYQLYEQKKRMGESFREEQIRNKEILRSFRENHANENFLKQQKIKKQIE